MNLTLLLALVQIVLTGPTKADIYDPNDSVTDADVVKVAGTTPFELAAHAEEGRNAKSKAGPLKVIPVTNMKRNGVVEEVEEWTPFDRLAAYRASQDYRAQNPVNHATMDEILKKLTEDHHLGLQKWYQSSELEYETDYQQFLRDPVAFDESSKSKLFKASVMFGQLERVKDMLDRYPQMTNWFFNGGAVLNLAANSGSIEMIQFFLQNDEYERRLFHREAIVDLMEAAWYGHFEILELMLTSKYIRNLQTSLGQHIDPVTLFMDIATLQYMPADTVTVLRDMERFQLYKIQNDFPVKWAAYIGNFDLLEVSLASYSEVPDLLAQEIVQFEALRQRNLHDRFTQILQKYSVVKLPRQSPFSKIQEGYDPSSVLESSFSDGSTQSVSIKSYSSDGQSLPQYPSSMLYSSGISSSHV